jgi:hypothetical protein
MMIEAFKRFDGQALGPDKVGECSVEREGKFGKTLVPPHTTPKNQFAPKPNQTHKLREKPSEKPIVQGNKHEKKPQPTPKANQTASIVSIVVGMVIRESLASGREGRRGLLGRWKTRPGTALLVVCLSLVLCLGVRVTSMDVVINDVTLTSLKAPEWSQLVFCDDFVLVTMVASHLFIGDEFGFSS